MSDFVLLVVGLAAGVGGAVGGYLTGLQRATDAYLEAGYSPPPPAREATIKECIQAVTTQANYCLDPLELNGIEKALEALRSMDMRGAGHYGVPRDTADAISRRALERIAKKEEEEG